MRHIGNTLSIDCLLASLLGVTEIAQELRVDAFQRELLRLLRLVNTVTVILAV